MLDENLFHGLQTGLNLHGSSAPVLRFYCKKLYFRGNPQTHINIMPRGLRVWNSWVRKLIFFFLLLKSIDICILNSNFLEKLFWNGQFLFCKNCLSCATGFKLYVLIKNQMKTLVNSRKFEVNNMYVPHWFLWVWLDLWLWKLDIFFSVSINFVSFIFWFYLELICIEKNVSLI